MSTGLILAILLVLMPTGALAAVSVPDTPAGHMLAAWLDAFNSGERARVEAFIKTSAPSLDVDNTAAWQAEIGAYELLEIYSEDKTTLFFRVKPRASGPEEIGRLKLRETGRATVESIRTWRIPAGATVDPVRLDAAARHRVVQRAADDFESFYVYPEIGRKIAAALRAHEKRGDYRSMLYGIDLATRLTEDLRDISHDRHAEVRFSFFVRPPQSPAAEAAAEARQLAANNCGFAKAEHLQPNVGYVKFDVFANAAICAPTASAAMNFVADSDALILDLRDNHGGGGGMVELVASYLFDQRTRLNEIVDRDGHRMHGSWTYAQVPGRKFIGKPVFVLTSQRTFSAAEDFAYSLRNLHRATLVGETTGGGAHPIDIKPIDDHFSAVVPFARSISPITQTDWEGTGIEPDVKVAADRALDVARQLAVEAGGRSP